MKIQGLFLIVLEVACMSALFSMGTAIAHQPEVRDLNGAPALFVDGKPFFTTMIMAPWHLYESTEQGQVKLRAEVESGYDLHSTCDELTLRDFEKMWTGPGQYNYELVDAKLRAIQQYHPNAFIFFKLYVQAPGWWVQSHPEEWVHYASGYEPDRSQGVTVNNGAKESTFISYASKPWQEDAKKMLEDFIHHLETAPGGDRVIGINVMNGHCQEWHYWGTIFGLMPDTGPVMTHHFRGWLKEKYQSDKALQEAWKDPGVTFETAQVPGVDLRQNSKNMFFRDPLQEAPVIDYQRCQHQLTADVLVDFCRVVKEASNNRLLAGAYYGYLFHCPWYPEGLSLGIHRVLESPYVDFLASPSNYNDWLARGLGGDSMVRGLPETVKAYGKLYISESDEGTYSTDIKYRACEQFANWAESIANTRKIFGQVLIRNTGNWWWDWEDNFGLYVHPENVQTLKEIKQIADTSLQGDRHSAAEVALVYSLDTLYYTSSSNGMANWEFIDIPTHVLARSGIPFDIITDREVGKSTLPDYKVLIFTQLFFADQAVRTRIHETLKKTHATALWVYAPGYVTPEGLSLEAMKDLTGFQFAREDKEAAQQIELVTSTHTILKDFDPTGSIMGIEIGKGSDNKVDICQNRKDFRIGGRNSVVGPTFWVNDPDCTVLGNLAGTSHTGLAVKKLPEWTSIYCSAIPTSTLLIRRIAEQAGVHIYNATDDVFMANHQFLCLTTRDRSGQRTVSLPGRFDIQEVFSGQVLGKETDHFEFDLQPRSTVYFQLTAPGTARPE